MDKHENKEIQSQNSRTQTGIQVQTYDECMKFADAVANSELVPKSYKAQGKSVDKIKADLFVAIAMGQELGLTPMAAIQGIAVVNGMPTIWGDAMLAIVRASNKIKAFREWDEGSFEGKDYVAYCESHRIGDDRSVVTKFTYDDANIAGLIKKAGTWTTHPKRMFKYKARSFNLRDQFPDVLKGLHSREEMEGEMIDVVANEVQRPTAFFESKSDLPILLDNKKIDNQVYIDTIDGFSLEEFRTIAPDFFADLNQKLDNETFNGIRMYGIERMKALESEQGNEQTSL